MASTNFIGGEAPAQLSQASSKSQSLHKESPNSDALSSESKPGKEGLIDEGRDRDLDPHCLSLDSTPDSCRPCPDLCLGLDPSRGLSQDRAQLGCRLVVQGRAPDSIAPRSGRQGDDAHLAPDVGCRLVAPECENALGLESPGRSLAANPCELAALERPRGEPSPPGVLRLHRLAESPSDELEPLAAWRGSLGNALADAPTAERLRLHCRAEDPDSGEETLELAPPPWPRGESCSEERLPRLDRLLRAEGRLPSDSV